MNLASSQLSVSPVGQSELAEWQAFVDSHAEAGPMHHAGWFGVLHDAFAVRPQFLAARDPSGRICGILPMYYSRSLLTGPHYCTLDGGILAESEQAREALLKAVDALRDEPGVRFVLVRGLRAATPPIAIPKVETIVRTAGGAASVWKAIQSRTRTYIEHEQREEPIDVIRDVGLCELARFYEFYTLRMRELGTPVFSAAALRAMREHLGSDRMRVYLLRYEHRPVGAALYFVHGKRWTNWLTIVRRERCPVRATDLLYWHPIREAAENGVTEVSLGRSARGSGVQNAKQKWGGYDVDLSYGIYPARGRPYRRSLYEGDDRGGGIYQRAWSRLPLGICNALGPILRRRLPFL